MLKSRAASGQLRAIDAAVLEGERPGGIDADDSDFGVGKKGLKILAEKPRVFRQRPKPASDDVVEWNIVIARHHDLGLWQGVEEPPRLGELAGPGALRQISGNHHHIGPRGTDSSGENWRNCRVNAPKVQI